MSRSEQRKEAVFLGYQADVTGRSVPELIAGKEDEDEVVSEFTNNLSQAVAASSAELDRLIADKAKGWSIERIAPLEKAIMRLAIYEMLYVPDVPNEVAIDEAVELAKQYCEQRAPAFVNGVLGSIQKEIPDG